MRLRSLRVKPAEIRALAERADPAVVGALGRMARRIEAFHRRQLTAGFELRAPDGSVLEERVLPLASAGLYVPGGRGAYPSSVLMGAIPARVAGVGRLVIVTPPLTLETNPAVAAAIAVAGVGEHVYRVGGAQAIAALAYGTRTIPAVDKIVGPRQRVGGGRQAAGARPRGGRQRGRPERDRDPGRRHGRRRPRRGRPARAGRARQRRRDGGAGDAVARAGDRGRPARGRGSATRWRIARARAALSRATRRPSSCATSPRE